MDSNFKFRFVKNGNPQGLFASKGSITEEGLKLGEEMLYYRSVIDSTTRDDRLILVTDLRDPEVSPQLREKMMGESAVLAVSGSGRAEALERAVDKFSSKIEAERHKARLEEAGEGHAFRCEVCPACESTVDLTGYEKTNFIYCRFCESIFGDGLESLKGSASYRTCDECGYHDRVQGYGEFYFYFLLVVYGFSHKRRWLCDTCAKSLANKLLAINSIFILGVPNAIICAIRARAGKDDRMKGLAKGNQQAKKSKMDKAEEHYKRALKIFKGHPGVHYNRALGYLTSNNVQEGIDSLKACLESCPNYLPAQRLQARLIQAASQ